MKRSSPTSNLDEIPSKRSAKIIADKLIDEDVDSGIDSFSEEEGDSDDGEGYPEMEVPQWVQDRLLENPTHIDKATFQSVVREIAQDMKNDIRFKGIAILGVQVAAEAYLMEVFREAGFQRLRSDNEDRRTMYESAMEMAAASILNDYFH